MEIGIAPTASGDGLSGGFRRCCVRLVVGALLTTGLGVGCAAPTCDKNRGEPLSYTEGYTSPDGTFYMTGDFDEPFLHFPGGRTYRFEHGLVRAPVVVGAYLAFEPCPYSKEVNEAGARPRCGPITESSDFSGAADPAGNHVMWERPTPSVLQVRNDTCAEFYLRVWAEVPASVLEFPDAGAQGD